MKKHIIVEGMDGSGKDTLIISLMKHFGSHTLHERASTSRGGPVSNLTAWAVRDVEAMQENHPAIYNRHPLISEPIYAPFRTINPGLKPPWDQPPWVNTLARKAANHSVVVICQPSYVRVRSNLIRSGREAHMPGVFDNSWALYEKYATLVWPGLVLRYNYEVDKPSTLASLIRKAVV